MKSVCLLEVGRVARAVETKEREMSKWSACGLQSSVSQSRLERNGSPVAIGVTEDVQCIAALLNFAEAARDLLIAGIRARPVTRNVELPTPDADAVLALWPQIPPPAPAPPTEQPHEWRVGDWADIDKEYDREYDRLQFGPEPRRVTELCGFNCVEIEGRGCWHRSLLRHVPPPAAAPIAEMKPTLESRPSRVEINAAKALGRVNELKTRLDKYNLK